jgi:hypothetical protein
MRRIVKFTIPFKQGLWTLPPLGRHHTLVSAQIQKKEQASAYLITGVPDRLSLWFIEHPTNFPDESKEMIFFLQETGKESPPSSFKYITTIQVLDGEYVLHLFQYF